MGRDRRRPSGAGGGRRPARGGDDVHSSARAGLGVREPRVADAELRADRHVAADAAAVAELGAEEQPLVRRPDVAPAQVVHDGGAKVEVAEVEPGARPEAGSEGIDGAANRRCHVAGAGG